MKAVLLDLDGTLLPIDFERWFASRYLPLIAATFARTHPGVDIVRTLLAATAVMLRNDGSRTNADCLREAWAPLVPVPWDELAEAFEVLYRDHLPALGADVVPIPEAAALLEQCRARGLRTALATNPVFPRSALAARLAWAGLSLGQFDTVTSVETARYCKPHPGYFRAIAAELGVETHECLMVGNDVELDLRGAAAVGMQTCLVDNPFRVPGREPFSPAMACTLAELAQRL